MDLADTLPRLTQITILAPLGLWTGSEVENTIKRNVLDFDFQDRIPLPRVPPDIRVVFSVYEYKEAHDGIAGRYQEAPDDDCE